MSTINNYWTLRVGVEARDLKVGDVILRRAEGEIERTPHEIESIEYDRGTVILRYTNGQVHYTSTRMRATVVG